MRIAVEPATVTTVVPRIIAAPKSDHDRARIDGIILDGLREVESGLGIAKRQMIARKSLHAVTGFKVSRYPSLFMAGGDAAGKYAEQLVGCDVLLLDDVFKAKPAERVEELIFAVVDERQSWERPCIITLNDSEATLESRLSSDRGPALIRRLQESCFAIAFRYLTSGREPDTLDGSFQRRP